MIIPKRIERLLPFFQNNFSSLRGTLILSPREMSRKRNAKKESEESVEKRARTDETDAIEKILELEKSLGKKLEAVSWPSRVAYVYNPLDYAFDLHAAYVRCGLAGNAKKKLLFLGMNPGPWGMAQNGVPFGEVEMVKQWFKFTGDVGKPPREHPDRKITGLACTKSEVSGKRLWGLFRDLCGKPDNFFRHAYLHNYCPIALMDSKACNITPADIKAIQFFLLFYASLSFVPFFVVFFIICSRILSCLNYLYTRKLS